MTSFQVFAFSFFLCLSLATAQISFSGGDGSSVANAIVIVGANDETEAAASEYDWIAKNRPEAVFLQQKLLQHSCKTFDIIILQTNGATEEIYFDITDFFGDF